MTLHPPRDQSLQDPRGGPAGNPLTITVLVGVALRENLTTTVAIESFVAHLSAGEAELEAGLDETLGRTKSLAASLGYGFAHAFTDTELSQLAVLHLFRDTVTASQVSRMGNQELSDDDAVPELSGLTEEAAAGLLERAKEIGLLTPPIADYYYTIHPALPWFFAKLFNRTYSPASAARASRAYIRTVVGWGAFLHHQYGQGHGREAIILLALNEGNLQHALTIARSGQQWEEVEGCLMSLRTLYTHTGRDAELRQLVAQTTADFTDLATGGPLPGREDQWSNFTAIRVKIAREDRDWVTATRLQKARLAWDQERAAAALRRNAITPEDRHDLRNLAVSLEYLGKIESDQRAPDALGHFKHALALYERIGAKVEAANVSLDIGRQYLYTPRLRDLEEAQRWTQRSLNSRSRDDKTGQASSLAQLGAIALDRFEEAVSSETVDQAAWRHLDNALSLYLQALPLASAYNLGHLAAIHTALGRIYSMKGETRQEALPHYLEALKYYEMLGRVYDAGRIRYSIAVTLRIHNNTGDALAYARAALRDFQRTVTGANRNIALAQNLIAELEQGKVPRSVSVRPEEAAGARSATEKASDSRRRNAADAYSLGDLLAGQGDTAGARAAYQKAIDSGHTDYAPAARVNLGALLAGQGDTAGARAAYQKAIDSGHPEHAPKAAYSLGDLLAGQGDTAGARAAYQKAIDSRHPRYARKATAGLESLLAEKGDTTAPQAAHQNATDSRGPRPAPKTSSNWGLLPAARRTFGLLRSRNRT